MIQAVTFLSPIIGGHLTQPLKWSPFSHHSNKVTSSFAREFFDFVPTSHMISP